MTGLDGVAALRRWRAQGAAGVRLGLVPTMGALHEGHLSLVRRAKRECDLAIASIFVNPLQFGPGEDFERYPRDVEGDRRLLESAACDAVFTIAPDDMYPPGFATYVVEDGPALPLEGAARPGHFRGVCTVVLKLLNLVQPFRSYFGQKDFQQTVVIRRMAFDLNVPGEIVVCPTVREEDGLALSSRNRYLTPEERPDALSLSRGLREAERLFAAGERRAAPILEAVRGAVLRAPRARLEYAAVADPTTLAPVDPVRPDDVVLVAARVGATRLIDNTILTGSP